jgi:hypothetical protein
VYFWTKFIFVEAYSSQWGYYYYLRHIPGFFYFLQEIFMEGVGWAFPWSHGYCSGEGSGLVIFIAAATSLYCYLT